MLKRTKRFNECRSCDYRYEKGNVKGCIFPNYAPIDSAAKSDCNMGTMLDIEIDEDFVQIKNVIPVRLI